MRITYALTAIAVGIGLTVAGCGDDDNSGGASDQAAFNDADIAFAQGMIPHHEQAIEMADIVLAAPDADPRVTELANQVKAAQAPEIEELGRWLDDWGAERSSEHSGHAGMDGMMSEEEMRALGDAAGPEVDRLFLEQMIAHHQGAIEMAQTETESGQDAGAVEMAQTIVDTQQDEIETMQELLASM